ncbi:SRPBCC family protein (plasmid) [Streptomyces sp. CWNU-52B]|uniref:SRPBCC family protein n=1 Tax=unclassified Streptomyces TaxID=2593676 RepID=UPI0039C2ECBF
MTHTEAEQATLFRISARTEVAASAADAYAVVSDLPRCGEWSTECRGGTWISGTPSAVGAVFRGENHRAEDVVAWAPVVRGEWTTEAEVVTAEPGRSFRWAMRDSAGRRQESVWGFDIEATDHGCAVTHHFRMGAPTEGIRGITAGMDATERRRFFSDWSAKVNADMTATVHRVKAVIEAD